MLNLLLQYGKIRNGLKSLIRNEEKITVVVKNTKYVLQYSTIFITVCRKSFVLAEIEICTVLYM